MTFTDVAERALDDLLRLDPVAATALGDHRYDDRLPDRGPEGLAAQVVTLRRHLGAVEAADEPAAPAPQRVDRAVLRTALTRRLHTLEEVREPEWDPLGWNPGGAVYLLLARDFAPLPDRLRSLAGRLAAVPEFLATARRTLGRMPRVHVETAIGQFTGTKTLLAVEVERALRAAPEQRRLVEPVRDRAVDALDEQLRWLRAALDDPARVDRDPRLGDRLYTAKLAQALDTTTDPDTLLGRAEAHLAATELRIAEVAARMGGSPRQVLDRLAAEGHVDDGTVVAQCEAALALAADAVRAADLVTVPDDPVEVIVMPEIHRGVAVAYCDPPGPLETARLPTYFAVAPTPADWSAARVASFYREYNAHMLHNLVVHEAMPGHAVQLAHARRHRGGSRVRAAFWSGPFVEGWAVLAEQLMVDRGYAGSGSADALRMQQLKMQLRMTINTILDVRVHTRGMTEAEAMTLMTGRGYQEEGEAAGKWRRALLTSAQLPTYFVGWSELSEVADELAEARPDLSDRGRHDALLAHGSPPPRHLRTLLGLTTG